MSRWLQNVGQFLDKLDDKAEQAAEDAQLLQQEQEEEASHLLLLPGGGGFGGGGNDNDGDDDVASILAARGLAAASTTTTTAVASAGDAALPLVVGGTGEQPDGGETQEEGEAPGIEASEEEGETEEEPAAVRASPPPPQDSATRSSSHQQQETEVDSVAEDPAAASSLVREQTIIKPEEEPEQGGPRESPPPPSEEPAAYTEDQEEGAAAAAAESSSKQLTTKDGSETEGDNTDIHPPSALPRQDGDPGTSAPTTEAPAPTTTETPPPPPPPPEDESTPGGAQQQQQNKMQFPRLSMAAKLKATAVAAVEKAVTTTTSSSTSAAAASTGSSTTGGVSSSSPSHKLLEESQKEARTLRRHVVSLNKQLETAESEIAAQRQELDRAGERLEKDAARHKRDLDGVKQMQVNETKAITTQHENSLRDMKARFDEQVKELRDQLRVLEQQRMQEGGNWNKELEDAMDREREASAKLAAVEDEKDTLLSHISTLQAQQEALGSRLESLTQTADSALEREREADHSLDEALSAHARQITQRQAREAELERTIAELGAALVAAGNNTSANNNANNDNSAPTAGGDSALSHLGTSALEGELEALSVQLFDEQQRNTALQEEKRELSRQRTEETSIAQTRQLLQDQNLSELEQTITRLKSELRDSQRNFIRDAALGGGRNIMDDEEDTVRRIKDLSEEVLRARERLSNSSSEISALKSRLQVALDRAKKSETAVEEWMENGSRDMTDDVESAGARSGGIGMRRRGDRIGRAREARTPTIRSALSLDTAQGEGTQRIGKSLDALDTFLMQSGKFLRYNPVARLLFICYLLLLHLWTFLLLFVHAHGFETIHGDFGAGGTLPHGPGAMMQVQGMQPAPPDGKPDGN